MIRSRLASLAFASLMSIAGQAFAITVYTAGLAVVLAVLGVSLRRRRTWPRGLAIALQLILLFLSGPMIRGGQVLLGLPALVRVELRTQARSARTKSSILPPSFWFARI